MSALPAPPAAATVARPQVSRLLAAGALALLLGLQPVASDVYLPALPLLTRELAAPMSAAQLTMALLFLGFGIGQLFWGPLADRLGRRLVLLAGLLLFTVASVACAMAPTIAWLIAARAVQGASLAAAVVCARAIVRDLYEPVEGAQVMSLALSGLGVIALLGPPLGGLATAAAGWRASLALVAICGVAVLAFVALRLPETVPRRNARATDIGPLLRAWRDIALHPTFVAWALLVTCSYGGLFVTLAASSFVYINLLGLSPAAFGLVLASNSLAYIAGTFICRRWVAGHGLVGAVRRAALLTLAAGIGIVALALAGVHSMWALLVPQWLYAVGHGVHQPVGQAAVVGPFPRHAGTASALAGFVLSLVAVATGLWLGRVLGDTAMPLAAGIGAWAAATALVALWLVPRAARIAGRVLPVAAA